MAMMMMIRMMMVVAIVILSDNYDFDRLFHTRFALFAYTVFTTKALAVLKTILLKVGKIPQSY